MCSIFKHTLWFCIFVYFGVAATADGNELRPEISSESKPAPINRIEFAGVQGEALNNVKLSVRLANRLRTQKALTPSEQRRLVRSAKSEIKAALEPFGYYRATIKTQRDTKSGSLKYEINVGQATKIASIDIQLNEQAKLQPEFVEWQRTFPLQKGEALLHQQYERAKKELLAIALNFGYFDARYKRSEIIINEALTTAAIFIDFDSGARYSIGDVNSNWNNSLLNKNERNHAIGQTIDAELYQSYLQVAKGQVYSIDALRNTQTELSSTPYFTAVDVQPGKPDQSTKTVPIDIILTAKKQRSYTLEFGAGTDTGLRGGVGYENRLVNRKGHTLSVRLGASELKRSVNLNYRVPLTRKPSDSWDFFAALEDENGDFRDFSKTRAGTQLSIAWRDSFLIFGITASRETSLQRDTDLVEREQTTDLILPSVSWQYTTADDLQFPTRGWSASLTLKAADTSLGSDVDLLQAVAKTNLLTPLYKGRLKSRLTLAGSVVDESALLPESLGFLTGGDETIRGYSFESIGALRNGETVTAKNLAVASVEYQHPIRNGLALATFIDIGDAFDNNADLKRGAGFGLRWRLPFGALRLDAASALDLEGRPWRLHFGFGTDL